MHIPKARRAEYRKKYVALPRVRRTYTNVRDNDSIFAVIFPYVAVVNQV